MSYTNARPDKVYFLQPVEGGNIKIGSSSEPMKRLTAHLAWSPVPLALLGAVPGSMEQERKVHRQFAHLRSHSEWFRPAPELLSFIGQAIAAGQLP